MDERKVKQFYQEELTPYLRDSRIHKRYLYLPTVDHYFRAIFIDRTSMKELSTVYAICRPLYALWPTSNMYFASEVSASKGLGVNLLPVVSHADKTAPSIIGQFPSRRAEIAEVIRNQYLPILCSIVKPDDYLLRLDLFTDNPILRIEQRLYTFALKKDWKRAAQLGRNVRSELEKNGFEHPGLLEAIRRCERAALEIESDPEAFHRRLLMKEMQSRATIFD